MRGNTAPLSSLVTYSFPTCHSSLVTRHFSLFFYRHRLHHYVRCGAVGAVCGRGGDVVYNVLTFDDAAELRVGGRQRIVRVPDEELRAVRVRARVRHRDGASRVGASVEFRRAVYLVVEAP